MEKEVFGGWIKEHACSIVDEVLNNPQQPTETYELYNDRGALINTFTCRTLALQVARKKHLTIRHVKKQVQQPIEEKKVTT